MSTIKKRLSELKKLYVNYSLIIGFNDKHRVVDTPFNSLWWQSIENITFYVANVGKDKELCVFAATDEEIPLSFTEDLRDQKFMSVFPINEDRNRVVLFDEVEYVYNTHTKKKARLFTKGDYSIIVNSDLVDNNNNVKSVIFIPSSSYKKTNENSLVFILEEGAQMEYSVI